jgi:hypothetical protein
MSRDESPSRIESLTVWGRARLILMGKSRGRNLIVLGIFLFFMAGVWAVIDRLLAGPDAELSISAVFVMAGMIAFFAGIAEYRAGN